MEAHRLLVPQKAPWNKGRLVGQEPPLRLKEIWSICLFVCSSPTEFGRLPSSILLWIASFVAVTLCDCASAM
jgi:hypothetical protein